MIGSGESQMEHMDENKLLRLAALHRHWIIADAVRVVLKQKVASPKQEETEIAQFGLEYVAFGEHASMLCRIFVWYALLYVVVEGYREIGDKYEPLDQLLGKEEYVDLLRLFRNATFHYQKDPLTEKLIGFLAKEDSESWIRDLNKQLDAYLMSVLPIKETMKKVKETGLPQVPSDSKINYLMKAGKHSP